MPFSAQKLFPLKYSVFMEIVVLALFCRIGTLERARGSIIFLFKVQVCDFSEQPSISKMDSPAMSGRSHTLVFRVIEYQLVIKCSVETRPKKACVSTLYLKWILIISELQNTPWPRPANAHIGVL